MLKGVLDQLGSLALEEHAIEEAARAAVARELGAQRGGRARVVPALRAPLVHREGQEPRRLAASREGLSPANSLHRRHSCRVHPSTPTDGSP